MEDGKAVIQAYVFPLVSWIWTGFFVLLFGTLICMIPSKSKDQRKQEPKRPALRPDVVEAELTR